MRVAVLNRRRDTHVGGDIVQIDATIEALARINIHAEYAPEGWDDAWLRTFDLAHVFHCNFPWSMYNHDGVMRAGIPYVLTPIFYPTTELGAGKAEIRGMLYAAAYITPNSWAERDEMLGVLEIRPKDTWDYPPMRAIPNGTDPMFHGPLNADGRAGVICVTPRAGDKNTDVVERACADLGILDQFEVVTGIVDRAELAARYKRALVFVNASESERMSLTTGEALAAGCRVIDTIGNRGGEWYGPGLLKDNTHLRFGLSSKIAWAIGTAAEWDYRPNVVAQSLTWDVVAKRLARVYAYVLRGEKSA